MKTNLMCPKKLSEMLGELQSFTPSIRSSAISTLLAMASLGSHADTATTSGTLSGVNSPTTYAPPIVSGTSTTFTHYSHSFRWTYALVPFYVGSTGLYSATSTSTPVVNTTWILSGTFSPNSVTDPSTPLSAFIVENFSGHTASFSNIALTAGQLYSFLVAFNNGAQSPETYSITMIGPGCISFSLTNNCQASFTPVSDQVSAGIASTLDALSASGSLSTNMSAALSTLTNLSDMQRAVAQKRLTPQANNAQLQGALASMNAGLTSVARRMDGIRNAGALAWAEPDWNNIQIASAGPITGLLEPKELRLGSWGRILGGHAKQSAQDGYAGYKTNTWGLTFGADQRLDSGTLVGAAFTYTKTDLNQQDYLAGSGSNVKNYQLTGYASRDLGNYYLDGQISYGRQQYSSQRDTQISGVATADFNGDIWALRLGSGIPLKVSDSTTVTPIASLEYERVSQDGYTETGADVLNLTVKSASVERVRSSIGVQLAADKQWGGMKVRPAVHVKWLHDFKNSGINTTASFAGGGSAFVTPGQKIARNSANFGASVLFAVKKNAALTVSYDLDTARGFRNQTAQIVGQIWF